MLVKVAWVTKGQLNGWNQFYNQLRVEQKYQHALFVTRTYDYIRLVYPTGFTVTILTLHCVSVRVVGVAVRNNDLYLLSLEYAQRA